MCGQMVTAVAPQRWILTVVATAWRLRSSSPMDRNFCDLTVYIRPLVFDLISLIFAMFIIS